MPCSRAFKIFCEKFIQNLLFKILFEEMYLPISKSGNK